MLKRLLEQQFDNPSPRERSILQVSSGFTYRYRMSAPPGEHVDADSITINGRRIGAADRVRVEASNFLVEGGNGYSVLREGVDKIVGISDIDALVQYFKAHSPKCCARAWTRSSGSATSTRWFSTSRRTRRSRLARRTASCAWTDPASRAES